MGTLTLNQMPCSKRSHAKSTKSKSVKGENKPYIVKPRWRPNLNKIARVCVGADNYAWKHFAKDYRNVRFKTQKDTEFELTKAIFDSMTVRIETIFMTKLQILFNVN